MLARTSTRLRRFSTHTQRAPRKNRGRNRGDSMRRMSLMLFILGLVSVLVAPAVRAQQPAGAADSGPDNPSELYKLQHSCFDLKGLIDCGQELFTGQPVHIAIGSIAPQNGFGAGLAYVGHKTTENWRNSWDADALGSINGSWRAGFYMKFVHTPASVIGVGFGTPPPMKENL